MHTKNVLAAVAAACLCVLLAGVALQERASRSPAALLAKGGKQGLYGYYPYPYGSYGYGYGGRLHADPPCKRLLIVASKGF